MGRVRHNSFLWDAGLDIEDPIPFSDPDRNFKITPFSVFLVRKNAQRDVPIFEVDGFFQWTCHVSFYHSILLERVNPR